MGLKELALFTLQLLDAPVGGIDCGLCLLPGTCDLGAEFGPDLVREPFRKLHNEDTPSELGRRIRAAREERGLTLTALANKSGVSKSYLSNLETKANHSRPSAQTLYAIGKALGVTMSELLGERLIAEPSAEIPESLRDFAKEAALAESDMQMLATIQLRGERPQTMDQWRWLYKAIEMSVEEPH